MSPEKEVADIIRKFEAILRTRSAETREAVLENILALNNEFQQEEQIIDENSKNRRIKISNLRTRLISRISDTFKNMKIDNTNEVSVTTMVNTYAEHITNYQLWKKFHKDNCISRSADDADSANEVDNKPTALASQDKLVFRPQKEGEPYYTKMVAFSMNNSPLIPK